MKSDRSKGIQQTIANMDQTQQMNRGQRLSKNRGEDTKKMSSLFLGLKSRSLAQN